MLCTLAAQREEEGLVMIRPGPRVRGSDFSEISWRPAGEYAVIPIYMNDLCFYKNA